MHKTYRGSQHNTTTQIHKSPEHTHLFNSELFPLEYIFVLFQSHSASPSHLFGPPPPASRRISHQQMVKSRNITVPQQKTCTVNPDMIMWPPI